MGKVEGYAVPDALCHHVCSEEVVMDGEGGGEKDTLQNLMLSATMSVERK
jgi:hypothetical protein